nr:RHS repeat-associated core domain-containing protein [Chryseobacterium sp. MEBOG06]
MDRVTNYYPFGLEFNENIVPAGSISQNYRYSAQGQEKQEDTKWSSFKWRNYDPTFGRFFSVDPLAEQYHTWSTYAFSGNRVVDSRELEGLEPKKVNEVSLPSDPIEFGELIYGGINSVRAAVANSVGRTVNVFTNDAISNQYKVEGGTLTLETGVPKESFGEKVVNGSYDLATIAMAAAGGPKGALMGKGGKAPAIKAVEEIKDAAKAVHGNSKLSTKPQHNYDVVDTKANNDVVKTGISGSKLNQNGTSRKGNVQANKWNRDENSPGRYKAVVTSQTPTGEGARIKALRKEKENADFNRETLDKEKHQRP